ncbi:MULTISPECIES: hypothetical protein [unclassified Streptomyces]|uniref:hypothetical protein n=1 Tax=unclassified Streptomyces TaxID=2593676 RepID=UPI0011B94C20|nr:MULTISPECIES: hypothetical protein [unclassified Streptomyces]MYT70000.1 hypothetical protein [Streptomyces sp. SID8367]
MEQLLKQPRQSLEEETERTFSSASACASVPAEQVLQESLDDLFCCPPQFRTDVLHLTKELLNPQEHLFHRGPVDGEVLNERVGVTFVGRWR